MDFKEMLFQYIFENTYRTLSRREEYRKAIAGRNAAEKALAETFSPQQQELFEEFAGKLLSVCEMESRYYFCEALAIIRELLAA